jgi:hypothetical protein
MDTEKKSVREYFMFTDEYNLMYHFHVAGGTIKEVATVPPDVRKDFRSFFSIRPLFILALVSSTDRFSYFCQPSSPFLN